MKSWNKACYSAVVIQNRITSVSILHHQFLNILNKIISIKLYNTWSFIIFAHYRANGNTLIDKSYHCICLKFRNHHNRMIFFSKGNYFFSGLMITSNNKAIGTKLQWFNLAIFVITNDNNIVFLNIFCQTGRLWRCNNDLTAGIKPLWTTCIKISIDGFQYVFKTGTASSNGIIIKYVHILLCNIRKRNYSHKALVLTYNRQSFRLIFIHYAPRSLYGNIGR